jgi:hypothetical protein
VVHAASTDAALARQFVAVDMAGVDHVVDVVRVHFRDLSNGFK